MADTVHHELERMLPELEDLEKRGLFTRSEIKEIVKRRRDFEYLLKRHSTLKQDYLRYVEYELKLEALRKLRKKRLTRGLKASGGKWKHSVSDKAGRMRIVGIYERAVTRFKGDLNLWLQYLEFCKSQAPTRMKKATMKCLRLHPTVPGLWMYAAAWEFEHNLNVNAARVLMQRGIRMCPKAENLWLEYFRLEIAYLQKLKARRLVLGLEAVPSSEGNRVTDKTGNDKSTTALSTDEGQPVDSNQRANGEREMSLLQDELSYKLAQSVFKNATAAVPSSLGFRQRFLEACDGFEFEKKYELERQIQESIALDFSEDELSWDWLARRHVGSERKAIEVFEAALQLRPTLRLYELYAKYLTDLLDSDLGPTSGSELGATGIDLNTHDTFQTLLGLYERAMAASVFSEVLATGHIELLLRSGKTEEALCKAEKFCKMAELRKSSAVWEWCITLDARNRASSRGVADEGIEMKDRIASVLKIFQDAMENVPFIDSKRLWLLVLELCIGHDTYINAIVEKLVTALSGASGGQVGSDIACAFVSGLLHTKGIKQARQLYQRLLRLPGPSSTFIKFCITMESRLVETGCKDAVQQVQKLFNIAVESFGRLDADLWIEYYRVELKAGNVDAANKVYWRARKALNDPTRFIEKYQTL